MRHLVDLKDWSADDANGMEVGDSNGEIIIVMRDYRSDNKLLHAQIIKGKAAQKEWAQYDRGAAIDTPTIFSTTMDVSGHKVGISYEKKNNSGSITVPLKVKNNDALFSLAFVGMSYQDALDIAKRFPWDVMEKTLEKN
jgi:hypothetical protein